MGGEAGRKEACQGPSSFHFCVYSDSSSRQPVESTPDTLNKIRQLSMDDYVGSTKAIVNHTFFPLDYV
ncbi:hypothetical protein Leryth_011938 [Lithospermum erythrorhizon]|nr:hypothetical protein Leryth_011938 [Lithospermum erythrorhizon]